MQTMLSACWTDSLPSRRAAGIPRGSASRWGSPWGTPCTTAWAHARWTPCSSPGPPSLRGPVCCSVSPFCLKKSKLMQLAPWLWLFQTWLGAKLEFWAVPWRELPPGYLIKVSPSLVPSIRNSRKEISTKPSSHSSKGCSVHLPPSCVIFNVALVTTWEGTRPFLCYSNKVYGHYLYFLSMNWVYFYLLPRYLILHSVCGTIEIIDKNDKAL